jgi:HSP20 family protein
MPGPDPHRILEGFEPFQAWCNLRRFPSIKLNDSGDCFVLTAELPGVAEDGLDLSNTGATLTIRGERKRHEGVAEEDPLGTRSFSPTRWSATPSGPSPARASSA